MIEANASEGVPAQRTARTGAAQVAHRSGQPGSDVAEGVRPPGDVNDVDWKAAENNGFPASAVTSFEEGRSRVSERAHEVEHCNLAATAVAGSRSQRPDGDAEVQRPEATRAHAPVGMAADVRSELAARHLLGRREVAGSDGKPENGSQSEKQPP